MAGPAPKDAPEERFRHHAAEPHCSSTLDATCRAKESGVIGRPDRGRWRLRFRARGFDGQI